MRTFRFEKIVRSGIPATLEQAGAVVRCREVSPEEAYQLFLDKVIEEACEAKTAPPDERAGELADLRAAVTAAEQMSGLLKAEILHAEFQKATNTGGFSPIVYVETVTVPSDNAWIAHFEANPDRYPEVTNPPEVT